MAYHNLLLSFEGRVAVLTVNRPEVRNALDGPTVGELHRALGEVRTARSTVLIVTGAGEKAFVSGADIRGLRDRRRDDALASMNSRLMSEVESHDAVVIAAVARAAEDADPLHGRPGAGQRPLGKSAMSRPNPAAASAP